MHRWTLVLFLAAAACGHQPALECGPDLISDGERCLPLACGQGTWGELEEADVWVDARALPGGDGTASAPFASVQRGVDVAGRSGGGVVAVAEATLSEVTIPGGSILGTTAEGAIPVYGLRDSRLVASGY